MALAVGRELFITMRIPQLQAEVLILSALYRGVNTEPAVVSYQCIMGNMKTQQEAAPKPLVPWLAGQIDLNSFFTKFGSTSFEIIILAQSQRQVVTAALSFDNLLCDSIKKKEVLKWGRITSLAREREMPHPVTSSAQNTFFHQTCEDSHWSDLARADYSPLPLSVVDTSRLARSQLR